MSALPDNGGIPGGALILSPENLHLFKHTLLKKSKTWFTPDVVLLQGTAGERYVLKDFSKRPFWIRRTWCRSAIKRETTAYRKLDALAGVPRLVAVLTPDAFVMDFLDGVPLPRRKCAESIPTGFFDELTRMIDDMHRLGVVHGDMRRKNMLIGDDGKPRIIDFETALTLSGNPISRSVFRAIARIDRITALKIKARYFPNDITQAEGSTLDHAPLHLRIGRFARKHIYGSLSPKHIRRRRRKAQERD